MRRVLLVSSLALTAALVPATSAFAYGQGDFYTRFGVAKVAPQSDNGDFGAPLNMKIDADDDSGFAFTLGYRFQDKLGVELLAAQRFEHQVRLNGSDMASIHHLPPTLTLQYYPLGGTDARVQPYLGAGINYTHFSDEKLDGGELELDDSWGGAAQVGVDLLIDDHWALNAAAWYLDIDSDATATLDGNDYHADVEIDPIVVMGGLSYRF
ncbi:OmpW/AlkL family protein [Chromohalobacter nigrandesensis]|uniref:OmpW/AlkL family protein n=1 Tax=Chromohalobacter nigrandesensis TaxID=119863 RepID=UPI001FF4A7AB|nr:OmpW family outer membrane protein [Chromohalobacter nigrandesensis]MCK0745112.1 outer membrane beta-barrel protein [Chromohalobacter nigrandesensis]